MGIWDDGFPPALLTKAQREALREINLKSYEQGASDRYIRARGIDQNTLDELLDLELIWRGLIGISNKAEYRWNLTAFGMWVVQEDIKERSRRE